MTYLPCSSCGEPLIPRQRIIFWASYNESKEFIHEACESQWSLFCDMRGTFSGSRDESPATRVRRRTSALSGAWQALEKYKAELRVKGMLPKDEDETTTPTEEECAR